MNKMCKMAESRRNLHTHTHTHTHGCLYKIIFSAIFAIATTIPSFATNITDSNKGCTSGNLTTSSGTAALEADWQANTVGVTFYSDNTQFDTASCTYDGTLTLPETDPTKTGYTFNGWKVRAVAAPVQQCSLKSGFDYAETPPSARGYARLNGNTGSNESTYGLTTAGEWVADYDADGGWVRGMARCSTVGSGMGIGQIGNPTDDLNVEGAYYCWCQINGFDEDMDGKYCSLISTSWVFQSSKTSCAKDCSFACVGTLAIRANFRNAIFGVLQ